MINQESEVTVSTENAVQSKSEFVPNAQRLANQLRLLKNLKTNAARKVHRQQTTILLYLYTHEKLSMPQLKSMMEVNGVTPYRWAITLKHLGLINWKGSHKNGAYIITDAGKEFVEKNG